MKWPLTLLAVTFLLTATLVRDTLNSELCIAVALVLAVDLMNGKRR